MRRTRLDAWLPATRTLARELTMMLRCRDIVDLLDQYLEGGLDTPTAEALDAHLRDCADCDAFLRTYRASVRTASRLRESELPNELRHRLRTFLKRRSGT